MTDYAKPFYTCHEVSQTCPVEATVLGYYPNFGVNITLAVGFGACLFFTSTVGLWKRTWGYTAFVTIGCALEVAGKYTTASTLQPVGACRRPAIPQRRSSLAARVCESHRLT